jgi:hypothetical protein
MCNSVPLPMPAALLLAQGVVAREDQPGFDYRIAHGIAVMRSRNCVRLLTDDPPPAAPAPPISRCAYCHTTTTAAIRCASCGAPR